jgi:2,3-dihydro-2,3-dihydroxybenzoate dehydrogenase
VHYPGVTGAACLVTGAAQGIGEAIARCLAEHGARVALVDSNRQRVDQVAREIRTDGGSAIAAPADVRDAAAIEAVVEDVVQEFRAMDILVNAAGVLRPGLVTTYDDGDFATTFAVNVAGVFQVSRAAARRMVSQRSGSIVTIGSNSDSVARMHMAAYSASKAAAATFTKCLGLELAQFGIRCNVVSPGSTDTPMQRSLWTETCGRAEAVSGSLDSFRVGIPLRELARPRDVANAVLFLVSDLAIHITMHELYVDGGASLRV